MLHFENPNQIKLVVTDMDGTLLNTNKELPDGIFEIIKTLHENGVVFAIATGRQYYNVRHLFEPVINQVSFIAENGAVTFQDDELTSTIPLPKDRWRAYLADSQKVPMAHPIVCGVKKAYIDCLDMDFLRNVANYYRRFEVIPDLSQIHHDEIIKIAICDLQNAERNAYPRLKHFEDEVIVKVSGDEWVDINAINCNKGTAIDVLQAKLGIGADQTMVFGDFLNDTDMMSRAYYSYAMANAHPELKKLVNFTAPSNNENGVVETLKEHFVLREESK